MSRALSLLLSAPLLAACTAAPPKTDAERRHEQTSLEQQRGNSALARADYRAARAQHEAALDRGRAVEDADATAIGLLNVAAVRHREGDLEGARARLEELLGRQPAFAAAYAGRAEARLALVELQSSRLEKALQHARRAEALCPAAGCAWKIPLGNVQAAIALRMGDSAAAETRARAVLVEAGAAGQVREEASAWRLLGEIAGERGRVAEARAALQAALELDRRAEAPERIALDLLALARLELAAGDRQLARAYAQRAASVAEAARLPAPLSAARILLRETE